MWRLVTTVTRDTAAGYRAAVTPGLGRYHSEEAAMADLPVELERATAEGFGHVALVGPDGAVIVALIGEAELGDEHGAAA